MIKSIFLAGMVGLVLAAVSLPAGQSSEPEPMPLPTAVGEEQEYDTEQAEPEADEWMRPPTDQTREYRPGNRYGQGANCYEQGANCYEQGERRPSSGAFSSRQGSRGCRRR